MAIQFRFIYDENAPVPASNWQDVEHGATVFAPDDEVFTAKLVAVQFRDSDLPIDEDDPKYFATVLINTVLDAVTDENGFYQGDPLSGLYTELAESMGAEL